MDINTVLEHFQTNATAYIVLGVCALPILFVTRKYSVPLILYAVEYAIYLLIVHSLFYAVLNLAKWFKTNSSMRALRADGTPADSPDWTMPYIEFWNRDLYVPSSVFWAEVVAAVLVFIAMWRYRPMKVQTNRERRYSDNGKKKVDFSKYNKRRTATEAPRSGARH